eukprot:3095919-Pyramimonas_sp.AAC.1
MGRFRLYFPIQLCVCGPLLQRLRRRSAGSAAPCADLWELVAAICSAQVPIEHGLKDCETVSFIDSNVALHTLIRGASRQDDYNEVVNDF